MIRKLMQNSRRGFTLIEVMVAMVIMMVGAMGLLQGINVALEHNLKNQMREEVVRVASDVMNGMRTGPFATTYDNVTAVKSQLRGVSRTYSVKRESATEGSNSSIRYNVSVTWKFKNQSTVHSIVSIRGMQ